ncbi:PTS sugar transporter subunit IIA [Pediococcus acidilactici]|uniref:Ascorbate-specific PTS system EIIA component n=1 Tax=Pediococcus acidilactici TaxID=1254 RepID=A0AAW8YQ40_PEDAC|nr:PTS sugar transporter subunit IIA [Pediococcus acidilactici]MDV2911958.1 PTS sugar transporter subunit IIA [Pediococcus acidilactici]WQS17583.1 PTS sugar transporter subunit IIA [Pediococcus acidilactici]
MLNELLTKDTIQYRDIDHLNWQEAIKVAAMPLIKNGSILPRYVESMIKISLKEGPYFNIGPEVVLAHARPTDGSNGIALALLKTKKDVCLINNQHPAKLWFVLAANDNQSHLMVIKELMQLLTDKKRVDLLLNAENKQSIEKIIVEGVGK